MFACDNEKNGYLCLVVFLLLMKIYVGFGVKIKEYEIFKVVHVHFIISTVAHLVHATFCNLAKITFIVFK